MYVKGFFKISYCTNFCSSPMTDLMYERLSNSTLDELAEYFEDLPELASCPDDYDVQYGVRHAR